MYYKNDHTQEDVLESTNTFLPQPEPDGKGYFFVYNIRWVSSNYYVKFKINGADYVRHQLESNVSTIAFNFSAINGHVHIPNSPVQFYGYNYYPQEEAMDCIFVK